jgi:hypothetical protein
MNTIASCTPGAARQHGQAAVEAILALAVFVMLSAGVAALGDLNWRGMDAAHASRYQAFLHARGAVSNAQAGHGSRGGGPPAFVQPGGAAAGGLRREWGAEDTGVVTAVKRFRSGIEPDWATGSRHTSLLVGAAHASDDAHAYRIIGASRTAWTVAAFPSIQAGKRVAATLHRIDSGWGREAPRFDWLSPWSDLAPAERVRANRTGAGGSAR